ncbi:unnamed protein product [Blepharisma stoltei]|uniref:50S ribosomal protein L22, chloroplastic n=1 Tax=Blepharisma stoltei TaxID=1481888 RepID=A0AAU9JVT6_9CILI|nr:unnamed protein product [Blepharisma stoltei]
MLSKIARGYRSWFNLSSVHLIFKKDHPKPIQHYTDRGLIIHPSQKTFTPPPTISLTFTPPESSFVPPPPPFHKVVVEKPPVVPRVAVALRKKIPSSMKKIVPLLHILKRIHVADAEYKLIALSYKKAADYLLRLLNAAVHNATTHKNLSVDRLFIKTIEVGRNTPGRFVKFHAKGLAARGESARVQVRITLEEKSPEDIYKIMMKGKFPAMLAAKLRNDFFHGGCDLSDLQAETSTMTAKGRQQQHLMLKRKVIQIDKENRKKGIIIAREDIEEAVLEEGAKQYAEDYWRAKKEQTEMLYTHRQEVFKNNEGIK